MKNADLVELYINKPWFGNSGASVEWNLFLQERISEVEIKKNRYE